MSQDLDDPFAGADIDTDDPFATSADLKRGFTPRPTLEDIEGRLVILVPRSVEDVKVPERFAKEANEMREQYTADLVVLSGGTLSFTYVDRSDKEEREVTVTQELPHLWTNVYVPQQSLIGQLKAAHKSPRPMILGVLRRGPQAPDKRAGKTFEDIESAFEKWLKNPKGAAPKFSWQIDPDIVTPEQKNIAMSWYRNARENGFTL